MSWFNASHLSTFAKQALTTAQKSIDRVLDITEDHWNDTAVIPEDNLPAKTPLSVGWGSTECDSLSEQTADIRPPSSDAIATPVSNTDVMDESQSACAFLPSKKGVESTQVVPVPPTTTSRRLQENKSQESVIYDDAEPHEPGPTDVSGENREAAQSQVAESKSAPSPPNPDTVLQPVSLVSSSSNRPLDDNIEKTKKSRVETDTAEGDISEDSQMEQSLLNSSEPLATQHVANSPCAHPAVTSETASSETSAPSFLKEIFLEPKEPKIEDHQNDIRPPPVSTFSLDTTTTSDIEVVVDHGSMPSESSTSKSSARSRHESAEGNSSLHLMQGSFQLLSVSTCGNSPPEDKPQLTESGGSSDAFECVDSFSVRSLQSWSSSLVELDAEIPGSYTLVVSVSSAEVQNVKGELVQKEGEEGAVVEEEEGKDGPTETIRDQPVDQMEERIQSITPVNSGQPEELMEQEAGIRSATLPGANPDAEQHLLQSITEDMESVSTCQILELQKAIVQLSSHLQEKESQLHTANKDKTSLEEECDNLKDEVQSLKEESITIKSLKDEFTQRVVEAEGKAQLACKERDMMEMKGRREEQSMIEIIRDKEKQIRVLLEEGEKLSKQQLQHSNIIKKLHVKDKENDARIIKQSKKVKEQEEELKHLHQALNGKEEMEKQHKENIKKLKGEVQRQEKELSRLMTVFEDLQENKKILQSALDSTYEELAELHKTKARMASEAQEASLSREIQAKEELGMALQKAQEEARLQQEALANQVADLRLALQRAEQQHGRREDYMRDEISEIQQRLQESETRNQELTQNVMSATQPLLRQIGNLQVTLGIKTASWENLQKSISDRLAEAQAQLAIAMDREHSVTDELLTVKAQLTSLKSQNSQLRQDQSRVLAQLDTEKHKRETLEDESCRLHAELENLRGDHSRALEETKKEKLLLISQLEMEKMTVGQEKNNTCYLAQEAHKERETKSMVLSAGELLASSTSTPLSHSSSISRPDNTGLDTSVPSQDGPLEHSLTTMMSLSVSGTNFYEAGGPGIIENLQSQLKLRSGKIAQLQLEISSMERSRSAMAEELVRLANQNEEMEDRLKDIPELKVQLRNLEKKHNTVLQMYGEKAEEATDLRLDLEDVKKMYKTHIDELLTKNQK